MIESMKSYLTIHFGYWIEWMNYPPPEAPVNILHANWKLSLISDLETKNQVQESTWVEDDVSTYIGLPSDSPSANPY